MSQPRAAISAALLVTGLIGLTLCTYNKAGQEDVVEEQEVEEVQVEEEVELLNGVFFCEYHKSKLQRLEGIAYYETIATQGGWNWLFHLHDDTAVFFTQTQGQFCYVHHVGEE